VSWFLLGIPLSSVFGGPLAGLLLGLDGWHGLHGWQWLFILEGLPAILLGVTTWFLLPDTPRDARWLKPDECALIERRISEEAARKRDDHVKGKHAPVGERAGIVKRPAGALDELVTEAALSRARFRGDQDDVRPT
jgi:MFS family permease